MGGWTGCENFFSLSHPAITLIEQPFMMTSHIHDLPDALLLSIVSFLTTPEDLIHWEAVSRHFRSILFLNNDNEGGSSSSNDLWKQVCQREWESKPRYRLTPAREEWLRQQNHQQHDGSTASFWKRCCAWARRDLKRKRITPQELAALGWYFNFTPIAGGRGRATLRRAYFEPDRNGEANRDDDNDSDDDDDEGRRRLGTLRLPQMPLFSYRLGLVGRLDEWPSIEVEPHWNNAEYAERLADFIRRHPEMRQALMVDDFPPHFVNRTDCGEWLITNEYVTFVSCDEEGTLLYEGRGFQDGSDADRDEDWM